MKQKQYRQGDVWIESVDSIPKTATKQPKEKPITLALGEVTGHHHTLERDTPDAADWWKDGQDDYVQVKKPANLTHQEHGTIVLPAGIYKKIQQREYTPEAIRNVAD